MFERKCVIVYFRNPQALKQLHQLGHVTYHHKKRRYAVVYMDGDRVEESIKKIQKIRHVRRVEISPLYEEINPQKMEIIEDIETDEELNEDI